MWSVHLTRIPGSFGSNNMVHTLYIDYLDTCVLIAIWSALHAAITHITGSNGVALRSICHAVNVEVCMLVCQHDLYLLTNDRCSFTLLQGH